MKTKNINITQKESLLIKIGEFFSNIAYDMFSTDNVKLGTIKNLNDHGFTVNVPELSSLNANGIFLFTAEKNSELIISCRGTTVDASILQCLDENGAGTTAIESNSNEVEKLFKDRIHSGIKSVVFTGHSLGGGVSQILTAKLAAKSTQFQSLENIYNVAYKSSGFSKKQLHAINESLDRSCVPIKKLYVSHRFDIYERLSGANKTSPQKGKHISSKRIVCHNSFMDFLANIFTLGIFAHAADVFCDDSESYEKSNIPLTTNDTLEVKIPKTCKVFQGDKTYSISFPIARLIDYIPLLNKVKFLKISNTQIRALFVLLLGMSILFYADLTLFGIQTTVSALIWLTYYTKSDRHLFAVFNDGFTYVKSYAFAAINMNQHTEGQQKNTLAKTEHEFSTSLVSKPS